MRLFAATLATETNTFAPMPTGLANFQAEGCYFPAGQHPPQMTLFSAPLWAARQRAAEQGLILAEWLVAMAQPSGTTTRAAFEALRDELLKSSQHFYASFAKIAKAVIYMAAPGSVTQDLTRLPYRKVVRPLWPLLD